MHRNLIRAAVAAPLLAVALVVPALSQAGPAHAATVHAATSAPGKHRMHAANTFAICSNNGNNITSGCLRLQNDSTTGGTPIFTSGHTLNNSEMWRIVPVDVNGCGGVVSNSGACPFNPGSGMNTTYNNAELACIDNFNGNPLGFSGTLTVGKNEGCGAGTTLLAFFNDQKFIDVSLSNFNGDQNFGENLCQVTNNGQADAERFSSLGNVPSRCSWAIP